MKPDSSSRPLSSDQRRLLQQLLQEAIGLTEARLAQWGIEASALLDTEGPIEHQVAHIRHAFLLGERAALSFPPGEQNYWQVIRARLQPIVLAYHTHERFVQGVLTGIDPKNEAALLTVYRERLENSERFRDIFFELDKRTREGGGAVVAHAEPVTGEAHDPQRNQFRTQDDTASIQQNVLTQLSKQLKELEKRDQDQQKTLTLKDREVATLVAERDQAQGHVARLEAELDRLRDELINIKLSADAGRRSTIASADPEAVVAKDVPVEDTAELSAELAASEMVLSGDDDIGALHERIATLEAEVASMSTAAYNAYMGSSDMSMVILFMLSSFQASTFERLGNEILRTVSTYGVKPTVALMTDTGPRYFAGAQTLANAESLIESRRNRGRIVEEGSTMLIYDGGVVLLVPDMPVNDTNRYERLRDNLATLVKGAAARAEAVTLATAAEKQRIQMERLLVKSDDVFKGISRGLEKQQLRLIKQIQMAGADLRTVLGISPGDPKSVALAVRLKKLEEALRGLFNADELVDPAFTKNVARVAGNIRDKQT